MVFLYAMKFHIVSDFKPTGDQPEAIQQLTEGLESRDKFQTLMGVTGSGKTFTVANVIEKVQRPTWCLRTIKPLLLNYTLSLSSFFQKTLLNTLFPITSIISLRHTSQQLELILKKTCRLTKKRKAQTKYNLFPIIRSKRCIGGLHQYRAYMGLETQSNFEKMIGVEVGQNPSHCVFTSTGAKLIRSNHS